MNDISPRRVPRLPSAALDRLEHARRAMLDAFRIALPELGSLGGAMEAEATANSMRQLATLHFDREAAGVHADVADGARDA